MDHPKYLTTREVADLLRCGIRKVAYDATNGVLPGAIRNGRNWLFSEAAILKWLQEKERQSATRAEQIKNLFKKPPVTPAQKILQDIRTKAASKDLTERYDAAIANRRPVAEKQPTALERLMSTSRRRAESASPGKQRSGR